MVDVVHFSVMLMWVVGNSVWAFVSVCLGLRRFKIYLGCGRVIFSLMSIMNLLECGSGIYHVLCFL